MFSYFIDPKGHFFGIVGRKRAKTGQANTHKQPISGSRFGQSRAGSDAVVESTLPRERFSSGKNGQLRPGTNCEESPIRYQNERHS